MQEVADKAKAAADAVKEKLADKRQEDDKQIYVAARTAAVLAKVPKMRVVSSELEALKNVETWEAPWVREGENVLALWANDKKVCKTLSAFGSQYSKLNDCRSTGRTQYPLQVGKGKEETEATLSQYLHPSICDLSAVAGGPAFMKAMWMFGFAPDMKACGMAPSCSATYRILNAGATHLLIVDTDSLLELVVKQLGEAGYVTSVQNMAVEQVLSTLENATVERICAWVDAGLLAWHHTQQPRQLVYIPQGFIVVEMSDTNGGNLHFGVRKSFIASDRKSADTFGAWVQLLLNAGRDVSRMQDIVKCMATAASPHVEEAPPVQ